MSPPLSAREDWAALRRRFAGEALARVLAFCGWQAGTDERDGPRGADGLFLWEEGGRTLLKTGPVELLWRGTPADGEPPDWPRSASPDAARFFLTARPLAEPVPLDLDLAARRDENNPYYFTCYIQKRLGALLSRREPEGLSAPSSLTGAGRALALAVGRFPAAVRRAAEGRDPYPVNRFAVELAAELRQFIHAVPMMGEHRRLGQAAGTALGNALDLLGVSG